MSCIVNKDCKDAVEILLRGFDLTWFCARKWRQGTSIALDTRIRSRPLSTGSEQPTTGYQYRAIVAGWTGEDEPAWPTELLGQVVDGSVTWQREAVDASSLERTITLPGDVDWTAESPMTVTDPSMNASGGQVIIAALHGGGVAGTRRSVWADVTFSDDSLERFEISWKIQ